MLGMPEAEYCSGVVAEPSAPCGKGARPKQQCWVFCEFLEFRTKAKPRVECKIETFKAGGRSHC